MRHPRAKMGLLRRLILLYGGIALLPSLVAIGFLVFFLQAQIAQLGASSHQQTLKWLQAHEEELERTSNKAAETVLAQIRDEQRKLMEGNAATLSQHQQSELKTTVADLSREMDNSAEEMQGHTDQIIRDSNVRLERSLLSAHERSHHQLTQEVTDANRRTIEQLANQSAEQVTRNAAGQITELLRNAVSMLALVAMQPALRSNQTQEAYWVLDTLQNRNPSYRLLALVNAEGEPIEVVGDEEPLREAAMPLYRACLESVLKGEIYRGQEIFPPDSQTRYPLLPIAVPIKVQGNRVTGAVFALFSMEQIGAIVQELRLSQTGNSLLCSDSGTILAHRYPDRIGRSEPDLTTKVRSFLATGVRTVESPVGENQPQAFLITAAPVPDHAWFLIAVQPVKEAYALAEQMESRLKKVSREMSDSMKTSLKATAVRSSQDVLSGVQRYRTRFGQRLASASQSMQKRTAQITQDVTRQQVNETSRLLERQTVRTGALVQAQMEEQRQRWYQDISRRLSPLTENTLSSLRERVFLTLGLALLLTLGLGIPGAMIITRHVVRPLRRLVGATHAIAQGDLSGHVQVHTTDELAELAESFNQMVDALAQSRRELNQTQAQLVQSAKLASLGTLASGIAHELNQPLAIIRAIAQQHLALLQGSGNNPAMGERDNGEMRDGESRREEGDDHHPQAASRKPQWEHLRTMLIDDLSLIESQTARMARIILHLRTFARKSGEQFEEVDVNTVIQNALILLREQLRNRGIVLEERYAGELPPIQGDSNALEQVFINLLTNARDALETHPNAAITITTQTITMEEGAWVEAGFADNGPGIPPEIVSQIFDPFFTTKEPGKGTGLGLSISYEIIQKHQGTIQVVSEPSAGTTFTIRIPVAKTQYAAA